MASTPPSAQPPPETEPPRLGRASAAAAGIKAVGVTAALVGRMGVPRGVRAPVRMTIRYQGPLQAPIAKGAEVAQLELRVGNEAPTHVPLVAGASVAKGGTLDRLRDGLAGIL